MFDTPCDWTLKTDCVIFYDSIDVKYLCHLLLRSKKIAVYSNSTINSEAKGPPKQHIETSEVKFIYKNLQQKRA